MKAPDYQQHLKQAGRLYAPTAVRVENLLARLDHVRQKGRNAWRAKCPVHGGDNPSSLSIAESEDGTILLHCFAHGCTPADIVAAVGLEMDDLFPDKPQRISRQRKRRVINEAILHELRVVWVAAQQVAGGIELDHSDLQRLWVAIDLIEKLGKEL